jgi:ribosomal protein L13E
MIGNDAGMGKNNAGIAALKMCDEKGIPAAAVAAMSAKIGNGMSTYEQGKISVANEAARKLGISVGMSAREAADKMLEGLVKGRK